MRFAVATAVLLSIASGCASAHEPNTRPPSETVRVVDGMGRVTEIPMDATSASSGIELDVPVERAWKGVVEAYPALGIPLTEIDPRSHMVGNREMRLRGRLGDTRLSSYLQCGRTQGGASANTYEVHLSVRTRLEPAGPGATTVRTQLDATARPSTFAGHDVRCSSTGRLERRIAVEVLLRATTTTSTHDGDGAGVMLLEGLDGLAEYLRTRES